MEKGFKNGDILSYDSPESSSNQDEKSLTHLEKIDKAKALKDLGNECYRKGDLRTAIKRYHVALLYLKGVEQKPAMGLLGFETSNESLLSREDKEIKDELEFGCYNNLAACLLKKQDYNKVVTYSTKALHIHPNSVKALFRRGQAYYYQRNIEKAEEDFKRVSEIDPNESAVRKYLVAVDAENKRQTEKQKQMYSEMFGKLGNS